MVTAADSVHLKIPQRLTHVHSIIQKIRSVQEAALESTWDFQFKGAVLTVHKRSILVHFQAKESTLNAINPHIYTVTESPAHLPVLCTAGRELLDFRVNTRISHPRI